jgi:hypothetical protein
MDGVLNNWLGPAIGGAVGAGAWVAGQVWDVGTNVVNTVVDAVTNATQPQPYEEWLNAPTNEFKPDGRFKPKTNPGAPGRTAEEIITTAAVQETQTGVSSPLGPEDPTEYKPLPPAPQNTDPQAPLTPTFQPIPEKAPVKTADANVVMSYFSPYEFNPDSSTGINVYTTFRGKKSTNYNGAGNQVVFSAVFKINDEGVVVWTARVQVLLKGTPRKTWEFDAGENPPHSGDFGLRMSIPEYGQNIDLLNPSNFFGGEKVTRFSVSEADLPNPITPIPEIVFEPPAESQALDVKGDPLSVNDSGWGEPQTFPGLPTIPYLPPIPPGTVPTSPNNPTNVPQIGTNGRPLPSISNVSNTYNTTHVIGGTKVNSGGIRKDIAGVAKEVGRIEQKTAKLLDRVGDGPGKDFNWTALWIAIQALQEIFEQPLPSKVFTIEGVCEEPLADGKQPSTSVFLPPEKYADRLISLGDVVPDLLQAHLGYKTPTCSPSKPPLEGDWITTRWQSDEKMDHSGRRLRKLFRYRSKSSRDLGQLSGYWESFTWRAGPVCVIHKGAWWGTPQIWAESAEEGKRVIRHAATEAGLNPDQVGRWEIGGSRAPRYGMSGTMRIHMHKGFPWVASRDGAAWPNYLAKEV